jgi:hypothetical protein
MASDFLEEFSKMTLFTSNSVLVPIDFSDEAHKALVDTLEFVGDPSKLHVIHVLSPLEPTEPGIVWKTVDNQTRIDKVKEAFMKNFLRMFIRRLLLPLSWVIQVPKLSIMPNKMVSI